MSYIASFNLMELFKHILTFQFFVLSLGGLLISSYFYILRKKTNGYGGLMLRLFGSKGIMFGAFGVVVLFELFPSYWIGSLMMMPYMWYQYKFILYIFNAIENQPNKKL